MARTPFYGRNDTKIAKMDMQAATAPGRAYAAAFKGLGEDIGGAIEKYAQNKKEGEAADMQIGAILLNMTPERQQEIKSRESELGKSLSKFIEGELPNSKKKALLGSLMTVNTADQLKRKEQMDAQRFLQQQELAKLNMQIARQNLARQKDADQLAEQERMSENQFFQKLPSLVTDPQAQRQADIARPGLAALGNGDARNRFMQAQLEDPRNQKRVLDLNDRDFLDQFKGDPRQTERALAFLEKRRQAELASQPKPLSPPDQLAREKFEYEKSKDLNKPIPLTDGEKARDRKFGDQLVEFNLPDINKGLEQLTEASEALSKSNTLSGPIVSLLPNFVGDRLNPESTEVREAVEEVVQRNLRLVLGAQFTEKEGERLISRAYNPRLDEAENKKRVERLIKSIKDAAQEKLNMKSYFEKNGTLKGYDSNQPSIASIEQSAFGESTPASQSLLDEIERKKQLRSKRAGL